MKAVGFRAATSAFLAVAMLSMVAAGCATSPAAPTKGAPYSQNDLVVGAGVAAVKGNTVTVNYTGWLYDSTKPEQKGLVIDTSLGRTPFSFTLGAGQVIAGWDLGIPNMKVGGMRRLVIPPSLAYGGTRNGPIPANTTLVFEIELLDVQ